MRSQNVSFLLIFHVNTIRFHFFSGVSARAEPHAESERIVFVLFLWVYDTFSLFLRCFCTRGAPYTAWEVSVKNMLRLHSNVSDVLALPFCPTNRR